MQGGEGELLRFLLSEEGRRSQKYLHMPSNAMNLDLRFTREWPTTGAGLFQQNPVMLLWHNLRCIFSICRRDELMQP